MMKVRVKYLSRARDITKKENEELELSDNSTLRDLVDILISKYGEEFKNYFYMGRDDRERPAPLVLVNKKLVDKISCEIKNGSEVVFMAAISGGGK
jgi:MoaD family protein